MSFGKKVQSVLSRASTGTTMSQELTSVALAAMFFLTAPQNLILTVGGQAFMMPKRAQ